MVVAAANHPTRHIYVVAPSVRATMSLGALARLPLKASDFASACLTADVPRQYLRLVLVRVAAMSIGSGSVDANRCRTVALLFDSRHPVERLCTAVRDAIRTSRTTRHETDTLINATLLLTCSKTGTETNAIDPEAASMPSVYEELTVPNGQLRNASRMKSGGALRAYRRHASVQSRVCMRRASAVLKEMTARRRRRTTAEPSALAEQFVDGLHRLGVLRPTRSIPDQSQCTAAAAAATDTSSEPCSCFMSRAVWRAGPSWLLIYAILPPVLAATATPHRPPTTTTTSSSWIEKLIDASASESEDVTNPLDALLEPVKWTGAEHDYLARMGSVASSDAHLIVADDDDDSSSQSDDNALPPLVVGTLSLVEAAVVWFFSTSDARSRLLALAKHSNMYYKTAVEHVVATTRHRDMVAHALRVAAAAPSANVLLAGVHAMPTAAAAFERLIYIVTTSASVWTVAAAEAHRRQRDSINVHSCESTGYSVIVVYAFLACCSAHPRTTATTTTPRKVNPWALYTFSPAIHIGDTVRV